MKRFIRGGVYMQILRACAVQYVYTFSNQVVYGLF